MKAEQPDDVFHALGAAVAAIWSRLPTELQHDLFEAAVHSGGEGMRERLAVHLHHHHARTWAGRTEQARQVPTPDSLGG